MYKRKDRNCWFWSCSGYPECDKAYPDLQGKPDFRSRVKPVVSAHKCQTCNKGLIRRKHRKGKTNTFGHALAIQTAQPRFCAPRDYCRSISHLY
ncbi:hypothetical protein L2D36_14200 [Vibrio harveyi]|uniref:hypothetical protein n=1 Tax=Vibrio TaxID=662 RepID=UPI0022CD5DC3|nr:hypothetical protein [Vibrio sp. NFR]MDA0134703.1 hypothetical protein [Vibrio sp. NFR]